MIKTYVINNGNAHLGQCVRDACMLMLVHLFIHMVLLFIQKQIHAKKMNISYVKCQLHDGMVRYLYGKSSAKGFIYLSVIVHIQMFAAVILCE